MNPEDPRHGTANGYGNLGCRCDACREAHRVATADYRRIYRARPWPPSVKHGTRNAYTNYGCRCDECKAADAAYNREYVARKETQA